MAATSRTVNYDALLTTTMDAYRPTLVDNIHNANPFWYWLNRAGHKKTQDGGANIIQGLMYGKNSTARSYSRYGILDTTPQDGITAAIYPWRQLSASITIDRLSTRQNSGKAEAINLLESKITQAEESLKEEANRQAFGDGTGNGSQDMFGLALLVEDGSAWLSDVAGINRSNETWWRNQYIGSVGAFSSNGVDKMRTLYNNCSKGNIHPDLGLTTQTVYEAYEKTLVPNERFLDASTGDAGFQNLLFKAMVLMYDTYVPSGTMWMLTSDYLWLVVDSQTDFITTEFQRPVDQDAKTAQILWYGNITMSNAARQGMLAGIS